MTKSTRAMPDLAYIEAANKRIGDVIIDTPLIPSAFATTDMELLLKLECVQQTGSFKARGALSALTALPEGVERVVCVSTGNHGRALAWAAGRTGRKAIVCLSSLVPQVKIDAIEALGAEVRQVGKSQDEAQTEVDRMVAAGEAHEVPPFDDADVVAGQGTAALEILARRKDVSTLLVPVSGGGLIAGIAVAAKALSPGIKVIGLSMNRGAAMAESLKVGRPVAVKEVASLADSLGGGIGLNNVYTFPLCRDLVDEVILLSEAEIYRGMQALFHGEGIVAEGACAVTHAALLAGKLKVEGTAAALVTGRNVDRAQFLAVASGQSVRLGDTVVEGTKWET